MVAYWGRKMKDLFSPDSHWHDLGEVKYELLFPGRLLLQFLQHNDFPKALSKLECVTYLPFPEQRVEQRGLAAPLQESDGAGNVSGATAEGIRWEFTPSLMQQSLPTLPGRKRRGQCLLLNPETHPGRRSIALECWAWGGCSNWKRNRTGGGQQCPVLEGNLSRKAAQRFDGWFQFPNC